MPYRDYSLIYNSKSKKTAGKLIMFKLTVSLAAVLLPLNASAATPSSVDLSLFNEKAMKTTPETVDCTLENGDAAQCAKLVLKYQPDDLKTGPYCPDTIEDVGGIWDWDGEKAGLYRIDKAFLQMLDEQGYTFYDQDGNVFSVDNASSPPSVDHACINVTADTEVTVTALIPITPVMADESTGLGTVAKVGIALAGAPIFADAPSVIDRGHMPALDTCAGHIDPGGWYHYHGTSSDLSTVYTHEDVDAECANHTQDPAALFGYAFDGIAIYGSTEADGAVPSDLDECSGHVGTLGESDVTAYHYHASNSFPNLPKCLKGAVAKNNFITTAEVGIGAPRSENETPADFNQIAKTLSVTAVQLIKALRDAGDQGTDLSSVADALGISEYALRAALPNRF